MRPMRVIYLSILFFCLICFSGKSQTWSLRGGPIGAFYVKKNVSTQDDYGNYLQTIREIHKPMLGGSLGANVQFDIGAKLSIRSGINFSYSGTNLNTYFSVDYKNSNYWYTDYDYIKIRTFSIGVPLLITIPIHKGKAIKYILIGGELKTNILGRQQLDRVYISEHIQYNDQFEPRKITFGNNYNQEMTRFNYMISAGFGVSYDRLSYELLFSHGLNNVINQNADPYETFYEVYQNNWRQVYLGLSIGYTFKDRKNSE